MALGKAAGEGCGEGGSQVRGTRSQTEAGRGVSGEAWGGRAPGGNRQAPSGEAEASSVVREVAWEGMWGGLIRELKGEHWV